MAEVEIAVLGGGPVGGALALALRAAGRTVAVLERQPGPGSGAAIPGAAFRPIALSYASRVILERLGAWAGLAATPIAAIHVSQTNGFGRTQLSAADAGVPALGYVVEYGALCSAISARLEVCGAEVISGARALAPELREDEIELEFERGGTAGRIRARCLAHAEGRAENAREKRYGYDAVIGLATVEPSARATAFERFTAEGPLALLPMAGGYAIVWSARPDRAAALAACAEEDFLAELALAMGTRAGSFRSVGARAVQPLALRVRDSRLAPRQVFVGNAAQALHPVAGQGLNLGLRDAWDLAAVWHSAPDPGAPTVLGRFAAARRWDAGATIRITDLLAGAYTGSNPLASAARGAAMTALDLLPPARRFFARRMIFGASAIP